MTEFKITTNKKKPCWETHPILTLREGYGSIKGANCGLPPSSDYPIFIGFDSSMAVTKRAFPWEEGKRIPFFKQNKAPPTGC